MPGLDKALAGAISLQARELGHANSRVLTSNEKISNASHALFARGGALGDTVEAASRIGGYCEDLGLISKHQNQILNIVGDAIKVNCGIYQLYAGLKAVYIAMSAKENAEATTETAVCAAIGPEGWRRIAIATGAAALFVASFGVGYAVGTGWRPDIHVKADYRTTQGRRDIQAEMNDQRSY